MFRSSRYKLANVFGKRLLPFLILQSIVRILIVTAFLRNEQFFAQFHASFKIITFCFDSPSHLLS